MRSCPQSRWCLLAFLLFNFTRCFKRFQFAARFYVAAWLRPLFVCRPSSPLPNLKLNFSTAGPPTASLLHSPVSQFSRSPPSVSISSLVLSETLQYNCLQATSKTRSPPDLPMVLLSCFSPGCYSSGESPVPWLPFPLSARYTLSALASFRDEAVPGSASRSWNRRTPMRSTTVPLSLFFTSGRRNRFHHARGPWDPACQSRLLRRLSSDSRTLP